jgi:nucleoid-associated protein YgaU
VKRGENLWTIARDELARSAPAGAGEPTNQEVFKYWRQVIKANKKDLWSGGDPNLIFPKEPIILPPVD